MTLQKVFQQTIAREIREQRQALGLTQAWLAEAVNTSEATVSRWEKGERRVGHYAYKRIKAVLCHVREEQAARNAAVVAKAMAVTQ